MATAKKDKMATAFPILLSREQQNRIVTAKK
jgi:hypothetical protein